MTLHQSTLPPLTHRHREQAPSHIGFYRFSKISHIPRSIPIKVLITCVYRLQPVCLARILMDARYDSYRITLHRDPRPRTTLRPRGRALPLQPADAVGGCEKT